MLVGGGCAQPAPERLQLRWPEPPLLTRIEHVRTIRSPWDLGPRVSPWQRFMAVLMGPTPQRGIRHPADLEVSRDGRTLYVSDFAQGLVHVLDLDSGEARYVGERPRLARPFGLALDSQDHLYIVEQSKRHIRVVNPAGETVDIFASDRLIRPTDLALDEARGRIYVADPARQDSAAHFVHVFDLDGNHIGQLGKGKGTAEGFLMFPTYLAVADDGRVFVSDTMNARISVFTPEGAFVRAIGTRGDGFGMFDKPKGVGFDSLGNLYAVDSSWSNVQIFGPRDDVLLYFGGRGGHPGLLRNPTGLAIARNSNTIFVGDYLNHRVGVYQLVNTKAGDGLPEK